MAQYEVGHAARLDAIQQELQNLPGVFLAGNAYSGIGISDCVRSGRVAAKDALEYLANGSARRCSVGGAAEAAP
jgi:oxygen-dependent protoporphyrinogen oxidase